MPRLANIISSRMNYFFKTDLGNAVNLNDVKEPGWYKNPANGNITLALNYPKATEYGSLFVEYIDTASARYIRQIWTILNGRTWVRCFNTSTSTWSAWYGEEFGQVILSDSHLTPLNTHTAFNLGNYPDLYRDATLLIRGWAGGGSGGVGHSGGSNGSGLATGGGGGGYFEMSIPLNYFANNYTIMRKPGGGGAAVTRSTQGFTLGNYGRSSQVYFIGPDGGNLILTAVGGEGGRALNNVVPGTMAGGLGGGCIILPAGNWTESSDYVNNIDHAQFTGDFHRLFGGTQGYGFIGGVGQNIVPGVNGGGGGGSVISVGNTGSTGNRAKSLNGGYGGDAAWRNGANGNASNGSLKGGGGGAIYCVNGGTVTSGAGGNGVIDLIIHRGGYMSPINFFNFTPLWS